MPPDDQRSADVSVIIPAYRARLSIGRALASVIAQTLKPQAVIVVDDGSDDGTFDAAESMRAQMTDIAFTVVAQKNLGAGAARNRGLTEATTTYVAFLDADDEWLPQKIARSVTALDNTGQVLVAHDYHRVEANGTEHTVKCAQRFKQAQDPFSHFFRLGFIATSTVVVQRDAVLAAGGFDETLETAQDFDLWLKILAGGAHFSVFDEALTRYHVTDGSISSFTARRLACSQRIACRHAPSLPDLWYRLLAVHYEAFAAFHSNGQSFQAFTSAARLPWALLVATMTTTLPQPSKPRIGTPKWLVAAMSVWVIGVFGAYIYRFQDLMIAALNMLKHL